MLGKCPYLSKGQERIFTIMSEKDVRICIIGGGPAGIAAGVYLEKKGYSNYVIYEKSDHVGGKCHSPVCNGKRFEMGAIMGVPSYYAVHDLEEFGGFTHDGPTLNRNYKNLKGKVINPFDPKKFWRLPHLLKLKKQVKKFGELLETKYKGYDLCGHLGVSEGRYDGYAVTPGREHVSGTNPNLKDLVLPFDQFCNLNGVPLVKEIWIGPFTSFGYGYFDEIPAAYVLKYLDFQTMMNFAKVNLWTWKDGTQSIYERVNAKLKNPVVLNSDITKVERGEKVTVTVNGKEEVFDKVIITSPLQFMDKYFDATEEEKGLFSKIDYERYDTQACIMNPKDYPDVSYYLMANMVSERLGHLMVYYRRWKDEKDQPIVTYILRKHKNSPEIPYEEGKKMAIDDLTFLQGKPEKILEDDGWYYFPHIFSEDYKNGWYEKVEAMQGKKNTFYAGEIMSFGDMDETCEYSHDLIERFF